MKNLTRAQRKREARQFSPGDLVTWGNGSVSHRVVEVTLRGVVVDVTHHPGADAYALRRQGGLVLLVLYDHNVQGPGPRCRHREHGVVSGPPILVEAVNARGRAR